ncbi:MAG: flagellar motor protein MotB, partial [Bacteroidota bacterium]
MKPQSYLSLPVSKIRFIAYFLTLAVLCSACNSGIQLYKKGNKKFESGEYQLAIEKYEKAKAKNFAPALSNLALAESYRLSDRLHKSAEFYQQALEAGTKDEDARYNYGFALKVLGKYKEAVSQFDQYVRANPKNLVQVARANKEIENLKIAEEIANAKTYFEIQNVSALNTEATEFSPVYKNDEIIFTSSRKSLTYKANGQKFLGLYSYKFKNDSLTSGSAKLFSDKLNLENLNEGCPTFSKDGKTMIFARGNTGKRKGTRDVDLYITKLKDGNWLEPKMLSVSIDSTWDSCPAIAADGKTLYFASNRVGGLGGIDLYRATLDAAGRVGRAVNMGKDINTAGDDMFPYVSEDGKMYFSSDGHPGLGGLDLFVATRNEGKIKIKNLGIPL